jgi:transcriptional regulator with XRE-family HTH domain
MKGKPNRRKDIPPIVHDIRNNLEKMIVRSKAALLREENKRIIKKQEYEKLKLQFINNLKILRDERGPIELAKELGISYRYLHYIERGERTPGNDLVERVNSYMETKPKKIFIEDLL